MERSLLMCSYGSGILPGASCKVFKYIREILKDRASESMLGYCVGLTSPRAPHGDWPGFTVAQKPSGIWRFRDESIQGFYGF